VFLSFGDEPAISVAIQSRYPWNGLVDVKFTITGTNETPYDVSFTAKDKVGGTNITMKTLYKSAGVAADVSCEKLLPGSYSWVWDAEADLGKNSVFEQVAVVGKLHTELPLYMVVDISGGASATSYPVSYLNDVPSGGWTTAHKTTQIVLRKIPKGTYKMQGVSDVTLTKDFYIGVFEVTQKQWMLVMGAWPNTAPSSTYGLGDSYPAYNVSYPNICGSVGGAEWPVSSAVDDTSFIGKLRSKTGIALFDLPTEAQWEYACRAGTTTAYFWGGSTNGEYLWYFNNSSQKTHPVGEKLPNAWGLYDICGNVEERCRDWYGTLVYGTDPKGPSSGTFRVTRGGSYATDSSVPYYSSNYRCFYSPGNNINSYGTGSGFRLSVTIEQ